MNTLHNPNHRAIGHSIVSPRVHRLASLLIGEDVVLPDALIPGQRFVHQTEAEMADASGAAVIALPSEEGWDA